MYINHWIQATPEIRVWPWVGCFSAEAYSVGDDHWDYSIFSNWRSKSFNSKVESWGSYHSVQNIAHVINTVSAQHPRRPSAQGCAFPLYSYSPSSHWFHYSKTPGYTLHSVVDKRDKEIRSLNKKSPIQEKLCFLVISSHNLVCAQLKLFFLQTFPLDDGAMALCSLGIKL